MGFVKYLEKEWIVISQTPFTFITLALLMFGISFIFHREVIKRLKEQKQLRDDDLAYLKENTGTESLKSVVDRLSTVESKLKDLGEEDFLTTYTKARGKISDLPKLP